MALFSPPPCLDICPLVTVFPATAWNSHGAQVLGEQSQNRRKSRVVASRLKDSLCWCSEVIFLFFQNALHQPPRLGIINKWYPEVKVSVPILVETAAVVEMVAVKEMTVSALEKQMAFIAILRTTPSSTSAQEAGPSTSSVTKVWCSTKPAHVVTGLQFKMLGKLLCLRFSHAACQIPSSNTPCCLCIISVYLSVWKPYLTKAALWLGFTPL